MSNVRFWLIMVAILGAVWFWADLMAEGRENAVNRVKWDLEHCFERLEQDSVDYDWRDIEQCADEVAQDRADAFDGVEREYP